MLFVHYHRISTRYGVTELAPGVWSPRGAPGRALCEAKRTERDWYRCCEVARMAAAWIIIGELSRASTRRFRSLDFGETLTGTLLGNQRGAYCSFPWILLMPRSAGVISRDIHHCREAADWRSLSWFRIIKRSSRVTGMISPLALKPHRVYRVSTDRTAAGSRTTGTINEVGRSWRLNLPKQTLPAWPNREDEIRRASCTLELDQPSFCHVEFHGIQTRGPRGPAVCGICSRRCGAFAVNKS